MAKRFPIPPPVVPPHLLGKTIDADLHKGIPEEALSALDKCGVLPLYNQVCQQWLPFALKKLETVVAPDAVAPVSKRLTNNRVGKLGNMGISTYWVRFFGSL